MLLQAKRGDSFGEFTRLIFQRCGCCRGLFHQRGVLLRDVIHLGDRLADLLNAAALFIGSGGDLRHNIGHAAYRLDDLAHGFARFAYLMRTVFDQIHRLRNQRLNLFGRLGAALRQAAHLAGDHREAAALFASARRFHRGVQRQNIGLEGDAVNDVGDFGDFL